MNSELDGALEEILSSLWYADVMYEKRYVHEDIYLVLGIMYL